jgi:hypothetical protein
MPHLPRNSRIHLPGFMRVRGILSSRVNVAVEAGIAQ